ncbi:HAD family hydrolase [Candidatus Neomarinimicrobiota bacterium]
MEAIRGNRLQTIIWDWNGTLLDDVGYAMDCMNQVLGKRHMPLLTEDRYRGIFGFPVKEYYQRAGFDFSTESFEVLSAEFITHYYGNLSTPKLYPGAKDLVSELGEMGIVQCILSAMEVEPLHQHLRMNGVYDAMKYIYGLNHTHATSKIEIGKNLLQQVGIRAGVGLFIGDTTHDIEVAEALGLEAVILAHGHQASERLSGCDSQVLHGFNDLRNHLQEHYRLPLR